MQYIYNLKIMVLISKLLLSCFLLLAALLEKKTDLDKRGMGLSDYSNGMNKPLVCRPSALSKDLSDRAAFLDKVKKWAADHFAAFLYKCYTFMKCFTFHVIYPLNISFIFTMSTC